MRTAVPLRGSANEIPRPIGLARERFSDRESIAWTQRSPVDTSHRAREVCRAATQRQRHDQSALDGKRRTRPAFTSAKAKPAAGAHREGLFMRDWSRIHQRFELRSRDDRHDVAVRDELRSDQRDLERRRHRIVSEQLIRAAMGVPVHRPCDRHPETLVASPAEILHGRQHAGFDHGQAGHSTRSHTLVRRYSSSSIRRKRTRSPG